MGILATHNAFGPQNMKTVRVLETLRARRRAKAKGWDMILPVPVSRLSENLHHVPIKDMEAWVSRPADVRRQEAQTKGKIARPMNSFMMYRSAYADRIKAWCAGNNHKFVSQISGLSWPREPPEIRDAYLFLALVERKNHQKAHPDYKFAPNKSRLPSRKKRSNHHGSDVDDAGYRLSSTASPKPDNLSRALSSRFMTPGASFADTHAAARPFGHVMNNGYSMSTSLASSPGSIDHKPLRPYGNSSAASIDATVTCMYDGHLDPQLFGSHQAGFDMRPYSHAKMSTAQPCPDQNPNTYISMTAPTGNNWYYDPLNTSCTLQHLEEEL